MNHFNVIARLLTGLFKNHFKARCCLRLFLNKGIVSELICYPLSLFLFLSPFPCQETHAPRSNTNDIRLLDNLIRQIKDRNFSNQCDFVGHIRNLRMYIIIFNYFYDEVYVIYIHIHNFLVFFNYKIYMLLLFVF